MYALPHTEVVAHRSTRRLAQKYIDSFADCLGDVTYWTGSESIPVHQEWAAVPSAEGGFDIVSTVTSREA